MIYLERPVSSMFIERGWGVGDFTFGPDELLIEDGPGELDLDLSLSRFSRISFRTINCCLRTKKFLFDCRVVFFFPFRSGVSPDLGYLGISCHRDSETICLEGEYSFQTRKGWLRQVIPVPEVIALPPVLAGVEWAEEFTKAEETHVVTYRAEWERSRGWKLQKQVDDHPWGSETLESRLVVTALAEFAQKVSDSQPPVVRPGSKRVEWREVRAVWGEPRPFMVLATPTDGGGWQFYERTTWEVGWYELPATPELCAKAEEKFGEQRVEWSEPKRDHEGLLRTFVITAVKADGQWRFSERTVSEEDSFEVPATPELEARAEQELGQQGAAE